MHKPHLFKTSITWKQPKSSLLKRTWPPPTTETCARIALHAQHIWSLRVCVCACVRWGGLGAALWSLALCTPTGQRAEQLKQSSGTCDFCGLSQASSAWRRRKRAFTQLHTPLGANKGGGSRCFISAFKHLIISAMDLYAAPSARLSRVDQITF